MGSTNTTTYYNLSQFIGTDKPAWLQDYNGDMLKIDTGINAAKLAADAAALDAGVAQNTADGAVSSIVTLNSTVSAHTTAITNLSGSVNTINSLIGNGTPTTTDQTIIGAINEINSHVTNISTSLTKTDITVAPQSADYTAYNNKSFVENGTVTLDLRMLYQNVAAFPANTYITIGTIEPEYAPVSNILVPTVITDGSSMPVAYGIVLIDTNGDIQVVMNTAITNPGIPIEVSYKI